MSFFKVLGFEVGSPTEDGRTSWSGGGNPTGTARLMIGTNERTSCHHSDLNLFPTQISQFVPFWPCQKCNHSSCLTIYWPEVQQTDSVWPVLGQIIVNNYIQKIPCKKMALPLKHSGSLALISVIICVFLIQTLAEFNIDDSGIITHDAYFV